LLIVACKKGETRRFRWRVGCADLNLRPDEAERTQAFSADGVQNDLNILPGLAVLLRRREPRLMS
jgi:hypothetical protein